jgi:hypothetical protein
MPDVARILGQPVNEEKWTKAKARAEEEGHAGDWDYVMTIYKRMMHLGEYTPKNVRYRKKKQMKVPEWREKKKYSPKQYQEVKKSSVDNTYQPTYNKSMRLVLAGKTVMDEFRCGVCKCLLFRGMHLEKSMIEVKCSHCATLNIS